MIRVELPYHLRTLAGITGEVQLSLEGTATAAAIIDALEARHPQLRGTIRDHQTHQRRPYVRYYACRQDLSHHPPNTPLPTEVVTGKEPFIILGALSGG